MADDPALVREVRGREGDTSLGLKAVEENLLWVQDLVDDLFTLYTQV